MLLVMVLKHTEDHATAFVIPQPMLSTRITSSTPLTGRPNHHQCQVAAPLSSEGQQSTQRNDSDPITSSRTNSNNNENTGHSSSSNKSSSNTRGSADDSATVRPQPKSPKEFNQKLQLLKRRKNGAQIAEKELLATVRDRPELVTSVSFNIVLSGYTMQSSRGDSSSPPRAETLLSVMHGADEYSPTTYTYNTVMEAWSKSRLPRAKSAILRLFTDMKNRGIEPDTFTYDMIISKDLPRAEEWIGIMKENGVQPDRQTYNLLFKSHALLGDADKAEALLQSLFDQAEHPDANPKLRPGQVWINNVINAHGKAKTPDAKRADHWLTKMKIWAEEGREDLRPDTSTYNQVMNVHASLGHTKRVMMLLEELEHRYESTKDSDLAPDKFTYTTAIKAQANNPQKADMLLQRMEESAAMGQRHLKPSIVTYTTVIGIWAATNTRAGLMRATEILNTMNAHPNSSTYAELIYGWARSGMRESGFRANEILDLLEALPPSKQRGAEMSKLYNAVILAWSRSGDPDAARRAEVLLDTLERKYANGDVTACPTLVTFISVSTTFAKAAMKDAADKCDVLLERMKKLSDSGVPGLHPNRILNNSILNAIAKSSREDSVERAEELLASMQASKDPEMQPDIVTYATVLDCYTKSGRSSDQRADEILAEVEERYAHGDDRLEPNAVFYSAILQAWAKSSSEEGARKAEGLLRRNEQWHAQDGHGFAKTHAIMYNAVIDALARSRQPDSGRKAERLLQEMEEKYQAGDNDYRPTRRSLNAVMLAYRRDVDGGQKAENILRRMEELTEAGVYDVMPDVVAYNCAIGAIAGSNEPNAADRAQALLDRMEQLREQGDKYMRPDGITYSCVIGAWLRRNDEKGITMANALLRKFFEKEEFRYDTKNTGAVLDVVKAHKMNYNEENMQTGQEIDSD